MENGRLDYDLHAKLLFVLAKKFYTFLLINQGKEN